MVPIKGDRASLCGPWQIGPMYSATSAHQTLHARKGPSKSLDVDP